MAAPGPSRVEPAQITDEELVERVLEGDEAAFELLYKRYFKRVFHFVSKRLRSREDTEETTQEVFINVFNSIGSYRGDAPFAAWVLGLTRRTIAGRFKRKRHTTVPLGSTEEIDGLAGPAASMRREPSPLEHYEYRERIEQIEHAATHELTPAQRRIFELHHLEDHSIGELALALDKSQDAVKSNLYRVRKVLLAR